MARRVLLIMAFLLIAVFVPTATASAAQSRVTPTYSSFIARELKATTFLASVLQDVSDDFSALDPYSAAYDLNRIKSRATSELRWLNNVRPRTCYLKLYNAVRSHYSAMVNMATYLRRWSLAYPYGTDSDYNNGARWMKLVTSRINTTTRVLDATHC